MVIGYERSIQPKQVRSGCDPELLPRLFSPPKCLILGPAACTCHSHLAIMRMKPSHRDWEDGAKLGNPCLQPTPLLREPLALIFGSQIKPGFCHLLTNSCSGLRLWSQKRDVEVLDPAMSGGEDTPSQRGLLANNGDVAIQGHRGRHPAQPGARTLWLASFVSLQENFLASGSQVT